MKIKLKLKEDVNDEFEVLSDEVALDVLEYYDERAMLLADYLEVDPRNVMKENEEVSPDNVFVYNLYIVVDVNGDTESRYVVLTGDEAYDISYNNYQELFYDMGLDAFGASPEYYALSDYFDNFMEEEERNYVDYMDDEEILYDAYASYDFLTSADFNLDENGEPDFSSPKNHVDVEDLRDRIIDERCSNYEDGVSWYLELFGERDLAEYMWNHPESIDIDSLIRNTIYMDGFGYSIGAYDGTEEDLGILSTGEELYAYRQD